MGKTLFERIGGEGAVRATVIKMYDKVLDDAELAPFFENIDVDKLRLSQTAFVTYAFGGPNHYTGSSLRSAHKNAVEHGLSDNHFDAVARHLKAAMEELSVPADLISEALAIVGSTRKDVLGQ
jgi:hemoglobin